MNTTVAWARLLVWALVVIAAPSATRAGEEGGGAAAPAQAQGEYDVLRARIGELVTGVKLEGALLGIDVREADSGGEIFAKGEDTPLNPASGTKLLTAMAALVHLGPEHRFTTSLFVAGKKGAGVAGDLCLKGTGDPSLESMHLARMVRTLAAKGYAKVAGDIVVDDTDFDDETLPPAFDQNPKEDADNPFRAPVGAASVDANTFEVAVAPPAKGGAAAVVTVTPAGLYPVRNETTAAAAGKGDVKVAMTGEGEGRAVRVWGAVGPSFAGSTWEVRADDPARLAGLVLAQLLDEAGIAFKGKVRTGTVPAGAKLAAKNESLPLSAILPRLGKDSKNFHAEQLLKAVGGKAGGLPGTFGKGAAAVTGLLAAAGADPAKVVVKNGSGLYGANSVSASDMTKLLRWAWRSPEYAPEFLSQLAVCGVDGTLGKKCAGGEGKRRVRAKTGTLKGVTSLSGYVLAPPGKRTVCFSIIANKTGGRSGVFKKLQQDIVDAIADFLYSDKK